MVRQEHVEEQLLIQRAIEESKRENVNPDLMSYEELLALGEKLGSVSKGFTPEEIAAIPSLQVEGPTTCAICCDGLKRGDRAKRLTCQHQYHDACIDPWLLKEKRCPVCNQNVELSNA